MDGRFVEPSKSARPVGDGLVCREGKIAFVGPAEKARAFAPDQGRCVSLGGRTVVPGWVDSHIHLYSFGKLRRECDLSGTASREEALERIAHFGAAHPATQWVLGRGYAMNGWADNSYPTAAQLDEAVSDRPCLLKSFDGHSVWANSAALTAAGLTAGAVDPPGGVILRDQAGNPQGCVLEAAVPMLSSALPTDTEDDISQTFRWAVDRLVRMGYTGVHVPLSVSDLPAVETKQWLDRIYPNNSCPLRICLFETVDRFDQARSAFDPGRSDRVEISGIKMFYDGALGSRTAFMFEPFCGQGDNCGVRSLEPDALRKWIRQVNEAGMPVTSHAIGDRACHETLQAFLEVGDRQAGNRIEHAQILQLQDMELFARGGVGVSLNPAHLWTDWRAANALLGPQRCRYSIAFSSLLAAGAAVSVGSDAPVVSPAPTHGLHAAVTRTDDKNLPEGGWHREECVSPAAWAAAASGGAWRSIGYNGRRGSLEVGDDCDLTVVREDFLADGFSEFLSLHVEATIIGGHLTSGKRPDRQ